MLKLNCDLGELPSALSNDTLIMPLIDQANIACGSHASSPLLMLNTVKLAVKHKVTIGAHPSYPDRENFGRVSMQLSDDDLIATLHYQIGALQAICQSQNTSICYVKPHGALYNDMMADLKIFELICRALSILDDTLALMLQALPDPKAYQDIADKYHLTLWYEAFADRGYQDNGLLLPRSEEGAVLDDADKVLTQITGLIKQQQLTTVNQQPLKLHVDTLCVHGDNTEALTLITALRALINELN